MRKISTDILAFIIVATIVVLSYGTSWLVTCGIVKLVTMCFDMEFQWKIATGIWLILISVKIFTTTLKNK